MAPRARPVRQKKTEGGTTVQHGGAAVCAVAARLLDQRSNAMSRCALCLGNDTDPDEVFTLIDTLMSCCRSASTATNSG
jgi:hypothetical protein